MTPPLFLLDRLPQLGEFDLVGDEGRHAARVRRVGRGERVWISDGLGGLLECDVTQVLPEGLRLAVRIARTLPEPSPRLVVVQALPKGERAELAVEVLTELGADEIVPWAASRSVTRWQRERGEKALAKWRRTAREAGKQSRRPRLPIVRDLASSADVAVLVTAGGFVLHEDATSSLAAAALPGRGADVVVVVGPEGGVAPEELAAFEAAGGVPVRLGETVLRTSTAGAAALAVLSSRLGRWA